MDYLWPWGTIWVWTGIGVWMGLVAPRYNDLWTNYKKYQLINGFVLTALLWPLALYTNRDRW